MNQQQGPGRFDPAKTTVLAAICLAFLAAAAAVSYYMPASFSGGEPKRTYILYGSGFRKVSRALYSEKIIRNRFVFEAFMLAGGGFKKIKAGEYEFLPSDSPAVVARKIMNGEVISHRILIPEGSDIYDVAGILAEKGFVNREEFLSLVKDRVFLKSIGINYDSAEGFLFPDTYSFIKGEGVKRIIAAMYERFLDKASILDVKSYYSPAGRSLTGYTILKMASIIEKESRLDAERPLVASVFYNRMNSAENYEKRLESCATVRYGINKRHGALTNRDIRIDTPYNTYIYIGLPPTPICNPGIKAIQAALKPAVSNYRYFVSRYNGSHTFSETLSEHNKAKYMNRKLRDSSQ